MRFLTPVTTRALGTPLQVDPSAAQNDFQLDAARSEKLGTSRTCWWRRAWVGQFGKTMHALMTTPGELNHPPSRAQFFLEILRTTSLARLSFSTSSGFSYRGIAGLARGTRDDASANTSHCGLANEEDQKAPRAP